MKPTLGQASIVAPIVVKTEQFYNCSMKISLRVVRVIVVLVWLMRFLCFIGLYNRKISLEAPSLAIRFQHPFTELIFLKPSP